MKINYEWLKEYLRGDLPPADRLADILNSHSYEVETIEESNGFKVLDIDILPNRASDSLSHRGVAREISSVTNLSFSEREILDVEGVSTNLEIEILEDKKCPRYIGRRISNINVGQSPEDLKNKLISIGQRPINNIVDILNFVMFDMGQPMHVFDADKVEGKIVVRSAQEGESMVTLDNKEINLSQGDLVISDQRKILALAGVKGGKAAEVTNSTKNIIVESANFNPVSTRTTSRRLQIITDASKRFENAVATELSKMAMAQATHLLKEFAGAMDQNIEKCVDTYLRPPLPYKLGVSVSEVNRVLGTSLTKEDIQGIWQKMGFRYEVVKPKEVIVDTAKKYLGVSYKYGASITYDAPRYFDCSGFVSFVYASAGVAIPRMTIDQYVFGEVIEKDSLQPGDIVFSQTSADSAEMTFNKLQEFFVGLINADKHTQKEVHYETKEFMPGTKISEGVSHNGIYLGNDEIIHASGKWHKGMVVIENLQDTPAFKNVRGYRRMCSDEERFVINVPAERLDLRVKEDLIEEIGRVYGLNNIAGVLPVAAHSGHAINKDIYLSEKIKDLLIGIGFDEVYTYSFQKKGEVEILNPLSKELPYMRATLSDGLREAVEFNLKNKELLGIDTISIFEVGKVFSNKGENINVGIAVRSLNKKVDARGILNEAISEINKDLDLKWEIIEIDNVYIAEANLEEVLEKTSIPSSYNFKLPRGSWAFQPFSNFPVALRDLAVWLPESESSSIENIIKEKAGSLLKRMDMFDTFKKEGRVSYAYHLVFQSPDTTLTDTEISNIMESINKEIRERGFEIR